MSEIKTKNIISAIKIRYINSTEKLNLRELADEYCVNYQYLRNCCSKGKWNKERERIMNEKNEGSYVNPQGESELLNILGQDIMTPLLLLDEMTQDVSKYFYNGDSISLGKMNEFLKAFKQVREEIQNTYNYVSPTNRLKIDTVLAKMSLIYGNNSNDSNEPIQDDFIKALVSPMEVKEE